MKTFLISTLLVPLATLPAAFAYAQISGTSDIDQQGSSRPVYGQNPQSSKMTPGGSRGEAAREGKAGVLPGKSSGGPERNDAATGSGRGDTGAGERASAGQTGSAAASGGQK